MKLRVWDLPTRLFHWLLVAAFVGLFITAQIGGGLMAWHARLGYTVLTLVLFRLIWGFVGGYWSRFSSFVSGPGSIVRYLKAPQQFAHKMGHNPLGSLSVLALLLLLLAQAATGLFANDDIAFTGPLNKFVSDATASLLTKYHKDVGIVALYVLIGLHVAAIAFYRWRKHQDLLGPMIRGDKEVEPRAVLPSKDGAAQRL
ncbi:MAG: cytochrome b/b6 domain-containing protein, partial [Betaproteobacteria bacterium]|nr:cytochrome b/b6 domain-containing protein [Betaproteobacteria bacterium]